jgi:hypothetical protein
MSYAPAIGARARRNQALCKGPDSSLRGTLDNEDGATSYARPGSDTGHATGYGYNLSLNIEPIHLVAVIHPSAWNMNSPKFAKTVSNITHLGDAPVLVPC